MLENVSTLMLGVAIVWLVVSVIRKFTSRPHGKNRESLRKSIETDTSEEETLVQRCQQQTEDLELELRIQDAQKRQRLEEQLQGIDHLFDDLTSEGDSSTAEQFPLPGRLSRLEASSSQSTDCDRARATPRSKHNKKKTQKHRKQDRNNEQCVVELCKTPGWIHIQGALAYTTRIIVYNNIVYELENYQERYPGQNIQPYIHTKFVMSKKDDMAVMSLIQGIHVSRYVTGDTRQALAQYKQLLRDIHTYHLKNPAIATAVVNRIMYEYYTFNGKPGKAHSALQAAVSCIEHHAPSLWTARVCHLEGYMYDRLAHVRPGHRSKYQDLALRCLTKTTEHSLYQPGMEEAYCLYVTLLYTLEKVIIKLDMPIFYKISTCHDSEIVYQRLSDWVVSQCQVTEAQELVRAVIPQATKLNVECINESILICHIILNIRLTQLAISEKKNKSALNHILTGIAVFNEWCDHASIYTDTDFECYPHLPRNIDNFLDNLYSRLILTSPPTPPPEPLSDSVSSEPSNAPPSGLKQLTEESRRAEKQARRDAHQFSYSSGDIHSDSKADVPSDVN